MTPMKIEKRKEGSGYLVVTETGETIGKASLVDGEWVSQRLDTHKRWTGKGAKISLAESLKASGYRYES